MANHSNQPSLNSPSLNNFSVILLSGGLDSAANLAFSVDAAVPVLALTCAYGQRAQFREIEAARKLAEFYKVPHEVVSIPWLGSLGGSSLTDAAQKIPELATSELDDRSVTEMSAKSVWVPNRNGVLINIAAAYAEKRGATRVVVGFNREEAATFPDNSADFLNRSTRALELSTANHVSVFSYTTEMDKLEIVRALRKLSVRFPMDMVWSCYFGGDHPCLSCESCRRFARATSTT